MYSFDSAVRYSEVDYAGQLSVPGIFDYFQDAALAEAELLGRGVARALDGGICWLLASWRVEIMRRPRFMDQVRPYTWAVAGKGVFAHRYFVLQDLKSNEPLACADSLWFVYDMDRRKVVRPPAEELAAYAAGMGHKGPAALATGRLVLPVAPRSIALPAEGGTDLAPIPVTEARLDTNKHVNNVQYVRMALEALESRGYTGADLSSIDVQFIHAAHLGDTVVPRVFGPTQQESATSGDRPLVALVHPGDNTVFAVLRA